MASDFFGKLGFLFRLDIGTFFRLDAEDVCRYNISQVDQYLSLMEGYSADSCEDRRMVAGWVVEYIEGFERSDQGYVQNFCGRELFNSLELKVSELRRRLDFFLED